MGIQGAGGREGRNVVSGELAGGLGHARPTDRPVSGSTPAVGSTAGTAPAPTRMPRWQKFSDGFWVTIPEPDGSCRLVSHRPAAVSQTGRVEITTIATFHRETGDPQATAEGNATLAAYAPALAEALMGLLDMGLVSPNPPRDVMSLDFTVWRERVALVERARGVLRAATTVWKDRGAAPAAEIGGGL